LSFNGDCNYDVADMKCDNFGNNRLKHRDIKDGYDVLNKKIVSSPNSKEFNEPRIQQLWKMATKADFTPEELHSLHVSLPPFI